MAVEAAEVAKAAVEAAEVARAAGAEEARPNHSSAASIPDKILTFFSIEAGKNNQMARLNAGERKR